MLLHIFYRQFCVKVYRFAAFFKKKSDFFAVIMINYGKTGNTKGVPEGTPQLVEKVYF